ncbi:M66 family metalloprotease [Chitinimonas viridis]|uniref:Dictomallein n=1 Tax=Chitinimonas viridis TaxID=664880 RepID=A0ABT8B823_9NEIS|nr:M66 family metalloprotease [Chitinimonas viridis]MDN3578409.1 M66 family metalloprotease [Chitinimonas viridis]
MTYLQRPIRRALLASLIATAFQAPAMAFECQTPMYAKSGRLCLPAVNVSAGSWVDQYDALLTLVPGSDPMRFRLEQGNLTTDRPGMAVLNLHDGRLLIPALSVDLGSGLQVMEAELALLAGVEPIEFVLSNAKAGPLVPNPAEIAIQDGKLLLPDVVTTLGEKGAVRRLRGVFAASSESGVLKLRLLDHGEATTTSRPALYSVADGNLVVPAMRLDGKLVRALFAPDREGWTLHASTELTEPQPGGGEGGGDGDGGGTGGGTGGGNGGGTGSGEPNPASFLSTPRLGAHDVDAGGKPRSLRNDLKGSLTAMVQFGQSHTIQPQGNRALNLPTLVAQRAALLLVSPASEVKSLKVRVTINGQDKGSYALKHPNLIPRSDYADNSGREDVLYSRRAWTVTLPWELVQPGMALQFEDEQGRSGTLAADQIEMAAPAEMVIHNLRLGMLTDAPVSDDHYMLTQPAKAAADYFQTVPLARLTLAHYETMKLDKVMVASGEIYTTASKDQGGTYDGDMRENVAKAQVSTGINLANFGIASARMNQSNPHVYNRRTLHHAQGLYANGVQGHGLSGGNGMATLYSSWGNELSHELGHSYELGHYPGADFSDPVTDQKLMHASHHSESGWGYIAYRDRMRANLHWGWAYGDGKSDINGKPFGQSFAGLYLYNRDAMAGGEVVSALSRYTHHTGYSALRIQDHLTLERYRYPSHVARPVPDASYPSGYKSWSVALGKYIDTRQANPAFNYLAPSKVGVPVFTLLGGYNPANAAQNLIYPAFRSNYGNVFKLPEPDLNAASRQCWMAISYRDGKLQRVNLDPSDGVKQFQINLEEAAAPTDARLTCRQAGQDTVLFRQSIPTGLPAMPAPAIVGQEAGYEVLRKQEMAELDGQLQALAGQAVPLLPAEAATKLAGWGNQLQGLGANAGKVAERIAAQRAAAQEIDAFLNRYRTELDQGSQDHKRQLAELLRRTGLAEGSERLLPQGGRLTVYGGKCLKLDTAAYPPLPVTVPAASCSNEAEQQWFSDARGAIHNRARPELCLSSDGSWAKAVTMAPCSLAATGQIWRQQADGHIQYGPNTGRVLDLATGPNHLVLYSQHSGSNQLFSALPVSASAAVVLLPSEQIARLYGLRMD